MNGGPTHAASEIWTVGGVTTQYVYDGDNIVMELDAAGNPTALFAHTGVDNPLAMFRGDSVYYYLRDHQGSITALMRRNGTVVNQYRYDPWGADELRQETVANPYSYTGREFESQIGLYYYRARWYDPVLRRFIGKDPIGLEGGINPYAYVGNDPVNYVDPSGLCGEWIRGVRVTIDCPWNTIQLDGLSNTQTRIRRPDVNAMSDAYMNERAAFDPSAHADGLRGNEEKLFMLVGQRTAAAQPYLEAYWTAVSSFLPVGGLGSGVARAGAAVSVGSGSGRIGQAVVVRGLARGEKVADLVNEAASLTYQTGLEHGIVSTTSGQRLLVSGGSGGISFGGWTNLRRVILHTHPLPAPPSAADFSMLSALGQRSSYIKNLYSGGLMKFSVY